MKIKMSDMFPINSDELEKLILDNSKKIIDDYFKNKIFQFLQQIALDLNLDHNMLLSKYINFHNNKSNIQVNICKGLTKNGSKCTHKCTNGSFFCKKHGKNPQNSEEIQSYFPEN